MNLLIHYYHEQCAFKLMNSIQEIATSVWICATRTSVYTCVACINCKQLTLGLAEASMALFYLFNFHLAVFSLAVAWVDRWLALSPFRTWLKPGVARGVVSPNDIHNSEKLRNPFLSGSAVLNAATWYVSCKNAHPQSKFRPIALQCTYNWSAFVLLAGNNNHFFLPYLTYFIPVRITKGP